QSGHSAVLLGQHGVRGWWYYFPVVLAVKTPIAFLLLVFLGAWLCLRRPTPFLRQPKPVRYLAPLAFSVGILAPAMNGHVNIGVRHILPIYISFSILAALAIVQLLEWGNSRQSAGVAAALLLTWLVASSAAHHPD